MIAQRIKTLEKKTIFFIPLFFFVVKQDEDKVVLTKKLHKKAYLCRLLIQTSEEFKKIKG